MQIDWWTLALQTVNFLIVVWLLTRFLYRPVRRIIEEREAADRKAAEDAAAKAEKAEAARRAYEEKFAALEDEARQKDAAFHAQLEKERDEALTAAQDEAATMRADAKKRIARDRDEALDGLRAEIAGLATALARKALANQPATPEDGVASAVAEIDGLPVAERDALRQNLATDGAALVVLTAQPVSDAARERWHEAVAERFGKNARLDFEEEPALLGGTRLLFPHAVMDFSVAGRLARASEELQG